LKYWPYYLAILIAILLVVVLVLVIRRRRKKRAEAGGGEPEPTALPRLNLRRVWTTFLRAMPREARHSIVLYQPFILFGAAASGKSELVDRCLDWQGQAAQFHPSHTEDPLVQIYHGKDAVVQELSVVLQGDVSQRARVALIKLWKDLRRGKEPRAVVVLDATSLTADPAEVLVKHAQLIRGKLNILSYVLRRPVKTIIALTHMDQIAGYLPFADFLGENKVPLSVSLDSAEALARLEQCLEPFSEQLPLALTTRPAAEYLQILSFLREAPKLLGPLGVFVKALQSPDPSTRPPQIERLCLTSNKDVPGQGANPLAAAITEEDVSRFRPLRKHRFAAAAIAVCGVAYLSAAYVSESGTIAEAGRLADSLSESTTVVYPTSARQRFFGYLAEHRGGARSWLLPSFHSGHPTFYKKKVHARWVQNLRTRIIMPRLKEPAATREMQKRVLFGLALLYGTEESQLGRLVLAELPQWVDTLEFPEELIRDYLRYAGPPTDIDLPLDLRRFDRTFNLPDGADYATSELFFQELSKATRATSITREHAQRLRTRAEALLVDVENIDRNRLLAEILELLQREGGPEIGVAWRQRIGRLPKIDSSSMQKLLHVLRSNEITPVELKNVHLPRLITLARQMASLEDKLAVDLRFTIAGQRYRFKSAEWHELIKRSRITLLLQEFTTTKAAEVLDVFFPSRVEYRGLTLAAGGGGESFFAGNAKVNGVFTKKAFEEQIKPALAAMPELLKILQGIAIPSEEREELANFVAQELEEYAERYVDEYTHYYRAFRYRAPTSSALEYMLTQLQSPASPLRKLLSDIEKNTSLEVEELGKHFEPVLQVQSTFGFLRGLVVKPKGGASGLDAFGAIMGKLQSAVVAKGADAPAEESDETAGLKSRLSPLGRVAFSIYRDDADSFYRQVETWLITAGVRSQWQEPFVGPVKEAYRLGLREINQVVGSEWDKLAEEYLQPLRTSFPFDTQSESDVTVAQLTEALHPKKGFWTTFKSTIAPVCQQRLGRWTRRTSRFEPVKLPASMLAQVNELGRLRQVLLDGKGNPRPLTVTVKPVTLPPHKTEDYVAVLAFLQAGESTVYAFNQQPSWQEVLLRWWKTESAAVGVAFAREGESKKTYRNLTVSESMWSFHRLLQLASVPKQKKTFWSWNVRGPGEGKSTVTIQFYTKRDPWSIFQTSFEAAKGGEEQDGGE
jgi:type VI protein secretion system component VasK